jgi:hypothetical protein
MKKGKMLRRRFLYVIAAIVMMAFVSSVIPNVSSVTTVQAATKVKLNKTKATLIVGNTVNLKVSGTSKKVTWKSSDSKVAKVSSKGVVTAKKKGSAKITATVDGKKYTCKVTVEKPSISDETAAITVGSTVSLSVDGTTQKVTWSSGDKSVAKVSKKGVVTGVLAGNTKITATVGGKKYTCKVTVKDDFSVSSDVSENIATLKRYIKANGSTNDDGNKFIKFESDGNSSSIIYKESDSALIFRYESSDGSTEGDMIIESEDNDKSLIFTLYSEGESYSYSIETTIDPKTYNTNDTYDFTFVKNDSTLKIDSLQVIGNTYMELVFLRWQLTLNKNLSMNLSDIGFTAF